MPQLRPHAVSGPAATAALLLLSLTAGCARVLPDYHAARDAALADPGPPPAGWAPDAVLHLSPELVDHAVEVALRTHGTLTSTLDAGVARVTPKLTVGRLDVRAAPDCDRCLRVDATLDGSLAWQSVIGGGQAPLTVDLVFDAAFEVAPVDDGVWVVTVEPRGLRDLDVEVAGAALSYAQLPIRRWVDQELLARVEPIRLAELGDATLPLRAARVVSAGRTVQIQALTASPRPGEVSTDRTRPDGGWQLDVAQDSLLGLARAATFRHGPVGYDVVPEPTSLAVDGAAFTLGLRLWRVRGRGWWRDYEVRGAVRTQGDAVRLVPESVEERGRSAGAVFVDPLAALGEGVILSTLERALASSVPSGHAAGAHGLRGEAEVQGVQGAGHVLSVTGDLRLSGGPQGRGRR